MPTREEILADLEEAEKAEKRAAILADLAAMDSVGIEPTPTEEYKWVPVVGSPGYFSEIEYQAAEEAKKLAEKRGLTPSEEQFAFEQEMDRKKRERERTITAGGGVEPSESILGTIFPPLRKSRLVDLDGKFYYRDPDTGGLREPTPFEALVESSARQEVMSEEEALGLALQKQMEKSAPKKQIGTTKAGYPIYETPEGAVVKNLLSQRERGEGVYETPFGAATRALPSYFPSAVEELVFGSGWFGTTRDKPVEFGADPEGKRAASGADSFIQRMAENTARGRTLGDELAQTPALVEGMKEATGENEEYARNALWGIGMLGEVVMPATPIGALETVGQAGVAAAKTTKAGRQAVSATKAATRAAGDRLLLGSVAKNTYPEVAKNIPRFASEDDVVRTVVAKIGLPEEEVRTTIRASVPDDYVQISRSHAAPRDVAMQVLEEAQEAVQSVNAAWRKTPDQAADLLDEALARGSKFDPRIKSLDDLTTRSMSPHPLGKSPSVLDNIIMRTFKAAYDELRSGPVRPDNALARAEYDRVRSMSYRVAQDLRDDIVKMAKDTKSKEELIYSLIEKHLSSFDAREALLDKIVEDGLGAVGSTNQKAASRAAKDWLMDQYSAPKRIGAVTYFEAGYPLIGSFQDSIRDLEKALGRAPSKDLDNKLMSLVVATIIEEVVKKAAVGDKGAAPRELARLQRGRSLRHGEARKNAPGSPITQLKTSLGDAWAAGADNAFAPSEMFQPEALTAGMFDSITRTFEEAGLLRKRGSLYLQSQFGPIPNVPVWLNRFVQASAIAVTQLGLIDAGLSAFEAFRLASPELIQGVLFKARDGVEWTYPMIKAKARELGLGLSAQDVGRQGLLTQDLITRVRRAIPSSRWDRVRTLVEGPAYAEWAGKLSDQYREAVFTAGLKKGLTPDMAAIVARRALLDFRNTNDFITQQATRYFSGAANTWGMMWTLGDTLARNPNLPVVSFRASSAIDRTNDPYGLQGDAAKKALFTLRLGDYTVLGPDNPLAWPVEGFLNTLIAIDRGLLGAKDVVSGTSGFGESAAAMAGAGARVVGGVLTGDIEPSEKVLAPIIARESRTPLRPEEMVAILYAMEDQFPGGKEMIRTNFPLDIVKPPKGMAFSPDINVWLNLPEDWRDKGLIWRRLDETEVSAFPDAQKEAARRAVIVYKLSPEAKNTLTAIRGVSPWILDEVTRGYAAKATKGAEYASRGTPGVKDWQLFMLEALAGQKALPTGSEGVVERYRATRAGEEE